MKHTLAIAQRQFASYFNGPVAYIVIGVVLIFINFFFWENFFLDGRATVRGMWMWLSWSTVFAAPALTMGLLAEERRTGTLETLLTLPIKDSSVVVGKFLGVWGLYGVLLLLTMATPITVAQFGDLDVGQVFAGYVGMMLYGGAMLAVGLMASSWTSSQIVAFFTSLTICLFIGIIIDKVLPLFPTDWASGLQLLSFDFHRQSMARGVIDSRDVIFFATVIVLPLLLAFRALESRRWR